MTDDKVEAWLKKVDKVFQPNYPKDIYGQEVYGLKVEHQKKLLALVRVYREAIVELGEQIGQDALQVKFETVWVDHTNVISNLEQSQANMEKWFTMTRDAEAKAEEIVDG